MIYKHYYANLIIRITLIVLTSIGFAYALGQPLKAYTSFLLLALIIIQALMLFHYLNKFNKEVMRLIVSIKDQDSSIKLDVNRMGSFSNVSMMLNETVSMLQTSRIETQKQYHFLQFVIENASVGLLAFNETGVIEFVNKTAKQVIGISRIITIGELTSVHIDLPKIIDALKPGQYEQLKIWKDDGLVHLMMHASLIKFQDKKVKLISIQNIKAELDEKEMESWQKLIRVLTHEIMNSITPITNLTYSIRRTLQEEMSTMDTSHSQKLSGAIDDTEVIETRSNNLMQFVENYRKLTKIGKIRRDKVSILQLFQNISQLMRESMLNNNIECLINVDESIHLSGDVKLLEQALINLVKNSIESLRNEDNGVIEFEATKLDNDVIMKIRDNGTGIPHDKLDDIFIPFYSTKETGSGIGLSLVKQIVQMHGGTISVNSVKGESTVFIVKI